MTFPTPGNERYLLESLERALDAYADVQTALEHKKYDEYEAADYWFSDFYDFTQS